MMKQTVRFVCAAWRRACRMLVVPFLMCIPAAAEAQYFTVGGIAYSVLSAEDHTVEVTWGNNYYHGNINIPSTVTYGGTTYDVVALGEEAFYRATLSGLTIPTSVSRIGYGCFLFSTGLSSINVPASVTEIETLAFAATNLSAVNVDEANPNYRTIDGMLFSKDTATLVECPMGKGGAVALPLNTRRIAPCAFAYCQQLTGVTLPEGLESIGYWAFLFDSRLNNVVIPSTVERVGMNVFGGCSGLNSLSVAAGNAHYYMDGLMLFSAGGDTLLSCHKSADSVFLPATLRVVSGFCQNSDIRYVNVPEGVTAILDNAFEGSSLVSVDLPSQMELMGAYAFGSCGLLTRVGMPSSLGEMGEGCFRECTSLKTIEIPDGLQTIPYGAFFVCTSLSSITWGDAVREIGPFAFGDCAFRQLQLPPTLRNIRQGAFVGDYIGYLYRVTFTGPVDTIEVEAFYDQYLESLQLKNLTPPATTGEGCLVNTDVDSIIIPCGSLDAYLADSYWGQFAGKYYENCDGIDEGTECAFDVYPNPATDRLTVAGATGTCFVEIADALGRTVISREIAGGNGEVDVSGLARGSYYVRMRDADGVKVKKVLLR